MQCKKDKKTDTNTADTNNTTPTVVTPKKIDTLKPFSYFPVFPGSYWKYLVNNKDTLLIQTNPTYEKSSYDIGFLFDQNKELYSDPVYVPVLTNPNPNHLYDYVFAATSKAIYQYSDIIKLGPPTMGSTGLNKALFLSEKIGAVITRGSYDGRYQDFRETVVVTQKTIINGDSVLILKGQYNKTNMPNLFSYEKYIKNVGLALRYVTDSISHDTVYKCKLLSYHIN